MPLPPTTSTSTSTSTTHEASLAFNATNLALAKSQRLLASWFPPPPPRSATHESPATMNLENQEQQGEQKEEDEHELFTSLPDLPGLGAEKGDDEGARRKREREGNDKLRRDLLGKDYGKGRRQGNVNIKVVGSEPRTIPVPAKRNERRDSISDDEFGRTSLGKAKNGARKRVREEEFDDAADDDGVVLETEKKMAAYVSKGRSQEGLKMKRKGGGGNYLDEVLADRLRRKKRKEKEKDGVKG